MTGYATGPQSGAVSYSYVYDKLYRLTDASGTAFARPGVIDAFESHFEYDDIHNMKVNKQVHTVRSLNGGTESNAYPPQSNHVWAYGYDPAHPHRATQVGDTLLVYDGNGNTVSECRDHGDPTCTIDHDHLRQLYWNEENRLTAVVEGGGRHVTRFLYDAAGERVVKQGRGGDVEYYPYGEVWWEPKYDRDGAGVKGQQFLFTSKELDEETGLYYFGARYYDPKS